LILEVYHNSYDITLNWSKKNISECGQKKFLFEIALKWAIILRASVFWRMLTKAFTGNFKLGKK